MDMLSTASAQGIDTILVESSRAVARDALVAEDLYRSATAKGIRIVPSDVPELFSESPTPVQKFLRRIMLAYTELEKDMTIHRLQHGLANRKKELQCVLRLGGATQKGSKKIKVHGKTVAAAHCLTQQGHTKANGRRSVLETFFDAATPAARAKLLGAAREHNKGSISLRSLAKQFSSILGQSVRHPLAQRMKEEIRLKWGL